MRLPCSMPEYFSCYRVCQMIRKAIDDRAIIASPSSRKCRLNFQLRAVMYSPTPNSRVVNDMA